MEHMRWTLPLLAEIDRLVGCFDAEGRLLWLNDGGLRMLGREPIRERDLTLGDVLHPTEAGRWGDAIAPALQANGRWSGRLCLQDRFGAPCPVDGLVVRVDSMSVKWAIVASDLASNESAAERARERDRLLQALLGGLFALAAVCLPDGTIVEATHGSDNESALVDTPLHLAAWWRHDPDVQEEVRRAVCSAASGKAMRFEATATLGDGRIVPLELAVTPLQAADGAVTHLVTSGLDLSDRIRFERRLAASQAASRAVAKARTLDQGVQGTLDAIVNVLGWDVAEWWVVGDGGSALERKHARLTSRLRRSAAWTDESDRVRFAQGEGLPGLAWAQGKAVWRVEDDPQAPPLGREAEAREAGLASSVAIPVHLADGGLGVLSLFARETWPVDPLLAGMLESLGLDLASLSVRQSQRVTIALRDRALDTVRLGILLCDANAPDLPIVFANHAFEEITRYPLQEVLGRNCRFLQGPETDPKAVDTLRAAIDAEQPARVVLRNYRKDGSPFWNEVSIAPVRGEDQIVTHFVGSMSDVSTRVETEQLLAQAREAAEAASRSKSHFVAAISHELRTPLGALLGFADVLLNEVADPRVRQLVEAMRRNGAHLTALVNDLLDIAGMEAGRLTLHREPVAVLSVLEDVRSLSLPKAIEKGLDLSFEFATRLPETVIADATRLRQIVLNLVGNAIKFTSVGKVTVHVACQGERRPRLALEVRDTGLGMTPAQQARLFQPFSRVHESATHRFPGTGLGLSICKHLVERMGGSIDVESTLGQGSAFRVDLPLEVPASAAWIDADRALVTLRTAGASASQPLPRLPAASRILLADDQPDIRAYLADLLAQAGADVETFDSGVGAIERVLEVQGSDETFDALVLDIQMPGRDGIEVLQHLHGAGDYTSAIAISAGAMAEERSRCLEAGFLRFFAKPLDAHRFLESVASVMGRRSRARSETVRSVLVVEDDPDAARSLALLIERWGCEVRIAESLREAVMMVRARRPQVIAVDMGLPDGDGATLPARLRDAGIDLEGLELGALTGEAGDAVARRVQAAGFAHHLVKPVDPDRLRTFCCP